MAISKLPTNRKDDIFDGPRRYEMLSNGEYVDTVTFRDVTDYYQTGDDFGATDINYICAAVNALIDELMSIRIAVPLSAWSDQKSTVDGRDYYTATLQSSGLPKESDTPDVFIAPAPGSTLPTKDQQAAYNRLDYAIVTGSNIVLYASRKPSESFYIYVK